MKKARTAVLVLSAVTALSLICTSVYASELELEALEGHTSASCFTYEKNNTAWAHLWNPYNEVSLYNTPDESLYGEGIQDLIVEFSVTGVEEPFTVFPGYQAYGDDLSRRNTRKRSTRSSRRNAVSSFLTMVGSPSNSTSE